MRPRLRNVLALFVSCMSACGLVYDVDDLSSDFGKECGALGEKCCAGGMCGEHLLCVDRVADAGDASSSDAGGCECDASAEGSDAQSSNTCSCKPTECVHCGGPSEPCCEGKLCSGNILTCESDKCTGCGALGQPCCELGQCEPGSTCNADVCEKEQSCGAAGEPCCNGTSCSGGLNCNASQICESVGPCGNSGDPCCTSGPACNRADLKCDGTSCQNCGHEGEGTCDSPVCVSPEYTPDASGICRTCPWAGHTCGTDPSRVCTGTGDGSLCTGCGSLGAACCSTTTPEPCPGNLHCCQGSGGGCVDCGGLPCTCKACCVRCINWAPGVFTTIPAAPDNCAGAADNYCAGKGGKAHGQWQTSC